MRVIGLDIGSYSIKATELEVGLRHLEVVSFVEERLPIKAETPSKEELKKAIQNLFINNHIYPPFKLVTTLEGKFISSRFIHLPFADKTKIAMALPAELEAHIPFPLDDIIFDYDIFVTEDNTARVLCLMAPKDAIQESLDLFAEIEISPDLLTTCNSTLFNLTYVNWEEPSEIYAFVDIGHTQTSVCVIEDGEIRQLRTISCAGKAITELIQKEYKLSYEEAEKAKIDNGFILTRESSASQDQVKYSDCIKTALEPVTTQINQLFQGLKSKGQGIVRKIFLSGGTSLMRNIGRHLSDTLQVEVEHAKNLNSFEMNNIPVNEETHAKATQSLGLALGYTGRHFSQQFNFRKDDFSKSKGGFFPPLK